MNSLIVYGDQLYIFVLSHSNQAFKDLLNNFEDAPESNLGVIDLDGFPVFPCLIIVS